MHAAHLLRCTARAAAGRTSHAPGPRPAPPRPSCLLPCLPPASLRYLYVFAGATGLMAASYLLPRMTPYLAP